MNYLLNFENKSNMFENSLNLLTKKNNGIYYTDTNLAEKMISDIDIKKNDLILDPCCGSGVFLSVANYLGYNNIYGIDADSEAISFCKKNIPNGKFINYDSIGTNSTALLNIFSINNKADIIIGNPPFVPLSNKLKIESDVLFQNYVHNSGNNLFVGALKRALDLVKENGIISYIIPKNFLHVSSYSMLRKEILKEKTIISVTDIGSYFKNVKGEQIILTIKNQKANENSNIIIKKLIDNNFKELVKIPQNFYKDEILLFNSLIDFNIYKKFSSTYTNIGDYCKGYIGRGKSKSVSAIKGKNIRKFGLKEQCVPCVGNQIFLQNIYSTESGIIGTFGGDLDASETVTVFTDGDEKMCRYILGILHSNICNMYLYKYCYNYSKVTMHTDAKYIKKIPIPKIDKYSSNFNEVIDVVYKLENTEYLSDAWFVYYRFLNKLIYQAYNITIKEAMYIDNEIKNIQSLKWSKNEI